MRKYFSEKEIEYVSAKLDKNQTIAGMFCAKEAVLKAFKIGIGKIALKSVEILHFSSGAPYLFCNQEILDLLKQNGLSRVEISISHSQNYAVAVCRLD